MSEELKQYEQVLKKLRASWRCKEFMHEEKAGEADSDALYLYVHDDNYCSVLEVSL